MTVKKKLRKAVRELKRLRTEDRKKKATIGRFCCRCCRCCRCW